MRARAGSRAPDARDLYPCSRDVTGQPRAAGVRAGDVKHVTHSLWPRTETSNSGCNAGKYPQPNYGDTAPTCFVRFSANCEPRNIAAAFIIVCATISIEKRDDFENNTRPELIVMDMCISNRSAYAELHPHATHRMLIPYPTQPSTFRA